MQDNYFIKMEKVARVLKGSGITLTNNEMKDIIKVIRFLENRESFLKVTTNRNINQNGGFINFIRSLMTAGLPFMKNVLCNKSW